MEITIEMEIFIIGHKMCYNEITGSFFSNMHARFSRLEAFSLTNAKLRCPFFALFFVVYFPMYLVSPIIKILLFRATERGFQMKWINGLKQNREFGLS